jgi:dTDP-4-amino-4,6-dideoxygalactose transaminase
VIRWLADKPAHLDREFVAELLGRSFAVNQLANGGPCVEYLEEDLRAKLEVADERAVIATASGTAALHALVAGLCAERGRPLRFAVPAFTFPSSVQGILANSVVVDIDEQGGLDLDQVPDDVDGVIVTNCFGHIVDIDRYEAWRARTGKLLLFDNAATPATYWRGSNSLNYGEGAIISLHHTKPIGFGEGGAVFVDRRWEGHIRGCIRHGGAGGFASNYKMSEVAAAYIGGHLRGFSRIRDAHAASMRDLRAAIGAGPTVRLFPSSVSDNFASCAALLLSGPVYESDFSHVGAIARKYYRPLAPRPVADAFYSRVLCLPLHEDLGPSDLATLVGAVR